MKGKLLRRTLLVSALLLCLLAVNVSAASVEDLTYNISNGKVTITDCSTSADGELVIPDTIEGYPVTGIGKYAFENCSRLKSVVIPDSVTDIGYDAFSGCSSLESVVIPDSVTSIRSSTFENCSSLESVVIGDSVTGIGNSAFRACSSLESVVIPDSVTSIGEAVFWECSSLESVVIGDSVTSIGQYAFEECSSLESVVIPDSVTSIGRYAFEGCSSLESVVIGASVTSIGEGAFGDDAWHSSSLASVEFLGAAPTNLGIWAFPSTEAGQFVIYYHQGQAGWTSPQWNGYYTACVEEVIADFGTLDENNRNSQGILFTLNDSAMTAIVGDNSSNANNSGYYGNNNGNVVIPDTVTKDGKTYQVIGVGGRAFGTSNSGAYGAVVPGNRPLKSVTLGANIRSVALTAFRDCGNLESIAAVEANTYYTGRDGVLFDKSLLYLYVYPAGKQTESYTVPDTVQTVAAYAFYNNTHLKTLTVPDAVTYMGDDALYGCTALEELTIPFIGNSREDAGRLDDIFDYSDSNNTYDLELKKVTVTDDALNTYSFRSFYTLEEVYLPAQGSRIPYECFYNCRNLHTVAFSDGAISEKGRIVLPEHITSIDSYAFYNCDSLTAVELPANVGPSAFSGCGSLETVTIGPAVSSIANDAFDGCPKLAEFIVDEENPNFSNDRWSVLFNKDKSTLLKYPAGRLWPYHNVPDTVKTVASYSFNTCRNLVNLYIPNTVTTLQSSWLYNCPGVTVCAYQGSAAFSAANSSGISAWPMDNYTLQGIEIYALPEQLEMQLGAEDFSQLYMVANYGGRQLQLDSYEVHYNAAPGVQTVTVTAGEESASFDVLLYSAGDRVVSFGALNIPDGTLAYAAAYASGGQMLDVQAVSVFNGEAKAVLSADVSARAQKVLLFIIDSDGYLLLDTAPAV